MRNPFRLFCLTWMLFAVIGPSVAQTGPQKASPATGKAQYRDTVSQAETDESVDAMMADLMKPTFDTTAVPRDALTAAIKELLEVTGAMNIGLQFAENIMNARNQDVSGKLPAEFYDRALEEFKTGETNRLMINSIIRIYRQQFTLDEIQALLKFYRTPVGSKVVKTMPEITRLSMEEGEKIGRYTGMKVYFQLVKEGIIKQ